MWFTRGLGKIGCMRAAGCAGRRGVPGWGRVLAMLLVGCWCANVSGQATNRPAGGGRKMSMRNEPTNAKESAQQKAVIEAEVDAKFKQWKATLPPDEQAWQTVLEQNLGDFYLPIHKKEKVEGVANAWDYVKDDPALPRVLLIGDSISRGYTLAVRKALAGKANVHRAPENCGPAANGLRKLDIWLGQGKWDLIHFNFGIHDRATPPEVYEQRLEALVGRLQKTGARLMWASSTPLPAGLEQYRQAVGGVPHRQYVAWSAAGSR